MKHSAELTPQDGEHLLALFLALAHLYLSARPVVARHAQRHRRAGGGLQQFHQLPQMLYLVFALSEHLSHHAWISLHLPTMAADRFGAKADLYR